MSKIVCDICGTTYDDASGSCPVCGWSQNSKLDVDSADLDTDFLDDELTADDGILGSAASKSKVAFDYDAVNNRRRPAPRPVTPVAKAEEDDDDEDEEEEEESGSNTFLVVILVILILALLGVSAYIGWTKILKPKMGSEDNKPQETITAQVEETTETTVFVPEFTEPVATGIPCTNLSLAGEMQTLTFAGQYWRLMVNKLPEDTTDVETYTSGNEAVVTIDEHGRITAVGEGETTIVITCGTQRIEVPVVVKYEAEQTVEPTVPETIAAPGSADTTVVVDTNTTVATPSSTLKLAKHDVTIGRRGVYITLDIEGGIAVEDIKWSTSDSSVATVYNGTVTAMGKGNCVIKAEYNGQTDECVVRCKF